MFFVSHPGFTPRDSESKPKIVPDSGASSSNPYNITRK